MDMENLPWSEIITAIVTIIVTLFGKSGINRMRSKR